MGHARCARVGFLPFLLALALAVGHAAAAAAASPSG